jgi:hypothetical protein
MSQALLGDPLRPGTLLGAEPAEGGIRDAGHRREDDRRLDAQAPQLERGSLDRHGSILRSGAASAAFAASQRRPVAVHRSTSVPATHSPGYAISLDTLQWARLAVTSTRRRITMNDMTSFLQFTGALVVVVGPLYALLWRMQGMFSDVRTEISTLAVRMSAVETDLTIIKTRLIAESPAP